MQDMPRPRPPYLHREKTRHGKFVWYVRKDGKRTRLRADYGTPEFQEEYQAALARRAGAQKTRAVRAGSVQWLWDRYRETTKWSDLSLATRRQRENIMRGVLASIGEQDASKINTGSIEASKDARRETPAQARNFLDAMRGLFRWAVKAKHLKADPTAGVENPERPTNATGFPAWSEEDISAYERCWAPGTRQRVWLHVLLYTGLRRGDAVRLGRQHVREDVATIRTEKTDIEVFLPILPTLASTLAIGPTGDLAFICGERGEPLTKESFGNMFSEACRKAGIRKSAHGVRKLAATIMVENGATVAELESVFGWQGGAMAMLYTKAANRKRLSVGAMHKLARTMVESGNETETETPEHRKNAAR